jgi:hypothetical protein
MAKVPYPIPVSIRSEPIHAGPGGLEHVFYFVPFHIWDVIRNPLKKYVSEELKPPTRFAQLVQ